MLGIADVIQTAVAPNYTGEVVLGIDANRIKPNKVHPPSRVETCMTGWIPRVVAENDSTFQHLIPYVGIMNTKGEVLVYERKGDEERLHGLLSIGWGGHIDKAHDRSIKDGAMDVVATIYNCIYREIEEELGIDLKDTATIVPQYFARHDKTAVDRVHACIAFAAVLVNPQDIADAGRYGDWVSLAPTDFAKYLNDREKNGQAHELETWSLDLYTEMSSLREKPDAIK